ncbi:hypothetical protein [Streptomyces olivoreticuli]|uniref:hypothetical protein n=1 Tax=Streptomyces olivoreticuli TaxID=68246 RepID=UPI000E2488CA|nr:hypothetical protein [Streptomyces olivoreticuli]
MNWLCKDLEASLAMVFGEAELGMLARAVVIAEILDDDGERNLTVFTTPGLAEWDALGMCRYGAAAIEASAGADFANGADE